MIHRDTRLPCKVKCKFYTTVDNQQAANVHIIEGDRKYIIDNHSVRSIIIPLEGGALKGQDVIDVEFNVDESGKQIHDQHW